VHDEEEIRFLQTLFNRPVAVTYVLFAINCAIFILMELAGGTTVESILLEFGAKSNYEINQGEVWRLVTPIFIHIGLLHLFFNSYALWMVGPQVEKLYGGARFLILYVLSGVGGVVASYWYHPDILSAGASGAIFGLFGVLFAFVIRYRKSIPEPFRRALGKGVFITIAVNLFIGFQIQFIDNSAHIGGLLAGAGLAFIIPYQKPHRATGTAFRVAEAALVVVVAGSFIQVARHYEGPALSIRNVGRGWLGGQPPEGRFVNAVNGARAAFQVSARRFSAAGPAELAEMKSDLGAAIDALQNAESIAPRPDRIARSLLRLLEDQYALVSAVEQQGNVTFELANRAEANLRQFDALMEDLDSWVAEEGRNYGIVGGSR
jgi:membrane associated rhomboid family serine protease